MTITSPDPTAERTWSEVARHLSAAADLALLRPRAHGAGLALTVHLAAEGAAELAPEQLARVLDGTPAPLPALSLAGHLECAHALAGLHPLAELPEGAGAVILQICDLIAEAGS